jgi:hypothetical protein
MVFLPFTFLLSMVDAYFFNVGAYDTCQRVVDGDFDYAADGCLDCGHAPGFSATGLVLDVR